VNGDPKILGHMAHNGSSDASLYFQTTNPDGTPIFTISRPPAHSTCKTAYVDVFTGPDWKTGILVFTRSFQSTSDSVFSSRAEAFNAFNHPNWGSPAMDPTNLTTFGKVLGKTDDARNPAAFAALLLLGRK